MESERPTTKCPVSWAWPGTHFGQVWVVRLMRADHGHKVQRAACWQTAALQPAAFQPCAALQTAPLQPVACSLRPCSPGLAPAPRQPASLQHGPMQYALFPPCILAACCLCTLATCSLAACPCTPSTDKPLALKARRTVGGQAHPPAQKPCRVSPDKSH